MPSNSRKHKFHGQYIVLIWDDEPAAEYAYGHISAEEMLALLQHYEAGYKITGPITVEHGYARFNVKNRSDFDRVLVEVTDRNRGVFPVTIWRPTRETASAGPDRQSDIHSSPISVLEI